MYFDSNELARDNGQATNPLLSAMTFTAGYDNSSSLPRTVSCLGCCHDNFRNNLAVIKRSQETLIAYIVCIRLLKAQRFQAAYESACVIDQCLRMKVSY